jgi:hypothetical protein
MVEIEIDGIRKFYYNDSNNKIYITDVNGNKLYVTNDFIDISYGSRESISSALSNMFPYTFYFHGFKVASVEGFLQSLKHQDPSMQQEVFNYYGKDAYHLRAASFINDWRKTGILYFNKEEISRFSIEYQKLLNELYLSLLSNRFFVNTLKYTGEKELIHSDGNLDPNETILTSKEYILRIEYMRDYLLAKMNKKKLENKLDTLAVVIAEEQAHIKKIN